MKYKNKLIPIIIYSSLCFFFSIVFGIVNKISFWNILFRGIVFSVMGAIIIVVVILLLPQIFRGIQVPSNINFFNKSSSDDDVSIFTKGENINILIDENENDEVETPGINNLDETSVGILDISSSNTLEKENYDDTHSTNERLTDIPFLNLDTAAEIDVPVVSSVQQSYGAGIIDGQNNSRKKSNTNDQKLDDTVNDTHKNYEKSPKNFSRAVASLLKNGNNGK